LHFKKSPVEGTTTYYDDLLDLPPTMVEPEGEETEDVLEITGAVTSSLAKGHRPEDDKIESITACHCF
jgi:hypothetical protein